MILRLDDGEQLATAQIDVAADFASGQRFHDGGMGRADDDDLLARNSGRKWKEPGPAGARPGEKDRNDLFHG